jgi:hypothetical protein
MATDLSQFTVPNDRFDVAQDNAAKLDSIVNGPSAVVTTRTGKGIQSIDRIIESIAAVTDRGAWVTATSYQVKDLVTDSGIFYIAVTAHTSGATFAGDIANWRVYQGVIESQGDLRYGTLFATVADMTAINPLSIDAGIVNIIIGMTLTVQGLDSPGDGEGGEFLATAAQTADGNRVVTLGNGLSAARIPAKITDFVYRKSVVDEFPLEFIGYATALATSPGATFLFPQGFSYDDAGNTFIKYAPDQSPVFSIIVVYDSTGTQTSWFGVATGGESAVVRNEGASRFLYNRSGSALFKYDITTLPTTADIVIGSDVGITAVGLQYSFGDEKWIIEQDFADLGVENSRTKWNIYDEDFNKTGEFFVSKSIVGFQDSSNTTFPFIPKTQGVLLKDGDVLFGLGGSYIPALDGATSDAVSDFGVARCSYEGSLIKYGAVQADSFLTSLSDAGFTIERTESEGLAAHPDGSLRHLFISLRPGNVNAPTDGIIIFKEDDASGVDYTDIASTYVPFDLKRLSLGIYPRGVDGGIYNPFTGVEFTALSDLLDFMVDMQIPSVSWYSSAVTLTAITGIDSIPTASLVTVKNANNETVIITVGSTSVDEGFITYFASKSGTWSATTTSIGVDYLRYGNRSGGATAGRLLKKHIDAGLEILSLQQLSTGGGNLLQIGGSSSYRCPTRTRIFTAVTTTEVTGVLTLEVKPGEVTPGVANSILCGSASLPWSGGNTQVAFTVTSDERTKSDLQSLDNIEKVVALELKAALKTYRLNTSIEEKGDAARTHTGIGAQTVKAIFESHGLDAHKYGLFCYDEWDEELEIVDEKSGDVVQFYKAAGEQYSIRYEELLCFIIAAM